MSNERAAGNEERDTPSVSRNLPQGLVSPRSKVNAESFPTRLSTRLRKPSEHVARKCCACSTSVSSRNDERKPHKTSGSANKAAVKKTSPLPCKDDSEIKQRRARFAELLILSKERASLKVQQDACRSKSGSSGKASATVAPKKSKGGQERVEASRTTLIGKQPATSPNETKVKTASPRKLGRTKVEPEVVNAHKVPTAKPARACSSKQPSKKTHSCLTTSKLKEPAVPKLKHGNEPKGRASQGQRVLKVKAEPKASNSQSKLSTESGSSAGGSDWSSESSDEHHISWKGFDQRTGWNCGFCEEDLAVASWGEDERETEFSQLPVVSVLSCGHAFHSHCLDTAGFAAQEGDPSCVLCESVNS